jgi:hypothetical protein
MTVGYEVTLRLRPRVVHATTRDVSLDLVPQLVETCEGFLAGQLQVVRVGLVIHRLPVRPRSMRPL